MRTRERVPGGRAEPRASASLSGASPRWQHGLQLRGRHAQRRETGPSCAAAEQMTRRATGYSRDRFVLR